jgi:hypothetical protein
LSCLNRKATPLVSNNPIFRGVCVRRANKDHKLLGCVYWEQKTWNTLLQRVGICNVVQNMLGDPRRGSTFSKLLVHIRTQSRKNSRTDWRCNLYSEQHFSFFFFSFLFFLFGQVWPFLCAIRIPSHPSCCLCTYSRANKHVPNTSIPYFLIRLAVFALILEQQARCKYIHSVSRHGMMTARSANKYLLAMADE